MINRLSRKAGLSLMSTESKAGWFGWYLSTEVWLIVGWSGIHRLWNVCITANLSEQWTEKLQRLLVHLILHSAQLLLCTSPTYATNSNQFIHF